MMTAEEYLKSKFYEFEEGLFVREVYPSEIYKWMEDYKALNEVKKLPIDLVSKSLCSADWCTNEVQSEGNKLCNMCRGHKE